VANGTQPNRLRISDLRRANAADTTLVNLLQTLTGKIQVCAKLGVFEYEAGTEGHEALAQAFRELAETERESFRVLLEHLRQHLNELPESHAGPDYRRSPSAVNR